MRILGIDPNEDTAAWVLWDSVEREVIESAEWPVEKFLGSVSTVLAFGGWPDVYVVERLESFQLRVNQATFKAQWHGGRIFHACGPLAYSITRKQVKLALLGTIIGNNADVRCALIDLHGGSRKAAMGVKKAPGPLYGLRKDQMQALAVAVAWATLEGDFVAL